MTHCKLSRWEDVCWWTYAKLAATKVGQFVTLAILTDSGKRGEDGKIVAEIVRSEWKIVEATE